MQYYFNNLDATSFQRLINGILVARFGEDIRLTPLYGADGGRDGKLLLVIHTLNLKFALKDLAQTINLCLPDRGDISLQKQGELSLEILSENYSET